MLCFREDPGSIHAPGIKLREHCILGGARLFADRPNPHTWGGWGGLKITLRTVLKPSREAGRGQSHYEDPPGCIKPPVYRNIEVADQLFVLSVPGAPTRER